MKKLRIVVGGFLGLLPSGGATWDYVQYPVGLAKLGCDVYYVEDTRLWPVFQADNAGGSDCTANVTHLTDVMQGFGLADRWAYRDEVSGTWFGLSQGQVREICRTADIFINISCSTFMREEYQAIPVRALIDSDPMFTQIQYVTQQTLTVGEPRIRELVNAHTHHFTFGENIGAPDCRIPQCGIDWLPTRQPVCLWLWPVTPAPAAQNASYTTVMNWATALPQEYDGETWGQKNVEWERISHLPQLVPEISLAVAVGQTTGAPFAADMARGRGWQVLDAAATVPEWRSYRSFIQRSRGECSVAKETYVKGRTGWFSCRSACYLASGRPVIVQDTGWSRFLPADAGLLAFRDVESAAQALRNVESDYGRHSKAAREIAETHFDSQVVLGKLLAQMGA